LNSPAEAAAQTRPTTFESLRNRNFSLFVTGLFVTGTGGWVQRIAQDWLILSITGSATAVGITSACQFLPSLVFGLLGGLIADRYPKRRVLLITQTSMSAVAGTLAILTLTHRVQVWQVYLLALALGLATAVDNPTRQSFVTELVSSHQLRNAVSLVSSTFQLGAMIGPVISGVLISTVGAGMSFAVNSVSYLGAITALLLMRLHPDSSSHARLDGGRRARDGLRFAASHPRVLWPISLAGILGMFSINLPVTLAAFAKTVFHSGAAGYGLLTSAVALGSVAGALVSARQSRQTRLRTLVCLAGTLAIAELLTGLAPSQATIVPFLLVLGASTLYFITTAQSMIQLATDHTLRGRVIGIYMLVFIGSGAIGGPLIGFIDQTLGPRAGLLIAGATSATATLLIAAHLARSGNLRVAIRYRGRYKPVAAIIPR
jgi:MFS family permease